MIKALVAKEPIIIRYDGLDAKRHEIELSALGESISGLARIIAVAANFATTEKFVQHKDAMAIRVVASPPEAHCFEVTTWLEWVNQSALASTIVGGLTVTLVSYIFSRLARDKAEMKELRGALESAIKELGTRDQATIDRLLDTVDKMADSLRPSAKKALAPIGITAATLSVRSDAPLARSRVLGLAEKEAIDMTEAAEILPEASFQVVFHEMNLDSTSCKVSLPDSPEGRIAAVITDPVANAPNNAYATAFASHHSMMV